MPQYFQLLALVKPTTQTGHCLSPVSAFYHILDCRIVTGGLSRWAAVQLLGEIRQVTCPSLVADQDKRHCSTPVCQAAIRAVRGGVVNSAFSIRQHFI